MMVALSLLAFQGCDDSGSLSPKIPSGIVAGAEEFLATQNGMRTTIVTDAKNQPHIAVDEGEAVRGTTLWFYDKVGGAWAQSSYNVAAQYNGGVVWVWAPHMEVDSKDRLWVSALAIGAGGGDCGQVYFARETISTAPAAPSQSFLGMKTVAPKFPWEWDSGLLSLDPAFPDEAIGVSHNSFWKRFAYDASNPNPLARLAATDSTPGQIPGVTGGEKTGFNISKAGSVAHKTSGLHGVWHVAGHGHRTYASRYQNSVRAENRQDPIKFASYIRYTGLGEDYVWPGVCGDNLNPLVAYISSDYRNWAAGGASSGGVCVNIYNPDINPDQMLRNPDVGEDNFTIDVDGTSGCQRFAPSMAAAKYGGIFITWMHGNRVRVRYVGSDGVMGVELDVADGQNPSVAVDGDGNAHLAYRNGGTIRYCKLTVNY